jgi:acyl-CoA synthetase (AMP-forming)/AMP-acid ligase II
MQNSISEQPQISSITSLLHASQNRFGELLRQVCELSGLTQGKLSREAKDERERLIKQGDIFPDDPIGSMEQPAISKVMAGIQGPTYLQVYIWLRVIRAHYQSARLAQICEELGIDTPVFHKKWEKALWQLSTFTPPEKLLQVYEATRDDKYIEIDEAIIEHKEIQWESEKRGFIAKGIHTRKRSSQNNAGNTSKSIPDTSHHSKKYSHPTRYF